jgi:formate-dependent nitrite reductase membrane component NrfD
MNEEVLATVRANAKVDPALAIWSWEVPVYLFLGGLTAGIMFFAAWAILSKREQQAPFAATKLALWAPIVLSAGMGALFMDLEHKLYVWRFYTTFQITSPMSWGSWILLVIYPVSILQILSTLRQGYPALSTFLARLPLGTQVMDLAEKHRRAIAGAAIPLAISLAIYTGILLSAFSARPFWNTGVLGPLFLISGLSSAAALAILVSKAPSEKHIFTRIDVGLILVELLLIALLVINLTTGADVQLQAAQHILGGEYTVFFWVYFVSLGLLIPLLLEFWEMRGGRALVFLGPILVLVGGYLLRHVTVELGQLSTWTNYAIQFDPGLLDRLH